ncbi:single-stranded DNA-binding protein [Vibrio splendidus]|uniref:single-stranded DNA-binding protein n=1 Tax=Vibrio splendidus TaxID=29497 RepID=UPI002A70CAC0|nr:Single-stranded DNA-binding protein [Vibrio crassostreae]CAK3688841.1 Single-stranded DNA-binding protein [Vibrio crassostreae]
MTACIVPNSQGFLAVTETAASECTGFIAVTAQEYFTLMTYTQLTNSEMTEAFGTGFALVFVGGYLLTYVVHVATQLINKL